MRKFVFWYLMSLKEYIYVKNHYFLSLLGNPKCQRREHTIKRQGRMQHGTLLQDNMEGGGGQNVPKGLKQNQQEFK